MFMQSFDSSQLSRFFSPGFAAEQRRKTKAVIELIRSSPNIEQDVKDAICTKSFIADLKTDGQKRRALAMASTAMFPNFDCQYVIIGTFGSIWIDTRYRGRNVRISINPDATTAETAYVIMDMESGDPIVVQDRLPDSLQIENNTLIAHN